MSPSSTNPKTTPFSDNSRSLTALGNVPSPNGINNMSTLGSTFGNGNASQAWGSDKIWGGGSLSSSRFTSRDATRENSRSRDGEQQTGKTGSGSLVDSSVSEGWGFRIGPRYGKRSVPSLDASPPSVGQQQRSASNAGLLSSNSAAVPTSLTLPRPPTIDLTSSSLSQRSTFANPPSTSQPPAVYTKFNRPSEPARTTQPDSAVGTWPSSTPFVSPTDERKNPFHAHLSRSASSRDQSTPPSRDGTENKPNVFKQELQFGASQRITPATSRAPSFPVQQRVPLNGFAEGTSDQFAYSLSQMGLNGHNTTPSLSSRPLVAQQNGSLVRGLGHHAATQGGDTTPGFGGNEFRSEDADDGTQATDGFMGIDDYIPQGLSTGLTAQFNASSLGDRFAQTSMGTDFRPNSTYSTSSMSPRTADASMAPRRAVEWQNFDISSLPMSTRSPGLPDPQAWLDPRVQQMVANHLRNPYSAMMNPYGLPTTIQLNSPFMQLPMFPAGVPGFDPSASPRDAHLMTDSVQSALMYEFKANAKTNKRYELRDIFDHVAEFSGDQHGSRFIQQKLETANSDEKERVFREILPNAIPLMTDVFGNYVIQKFFEHGDQNQKKALANKMRGQVLNLSLQMYGCRVVQKALEHVLVDQQALIICEIENSVLKCVKDQNGNHVIQKAIERCQSSTIQFIIAAFQGQVQSLSVHSYGCRVIQRCLEHCDMASKAMIMLELHDGMASLITDQYGNYVVQHVVEHGGEQDRLRVLQLVGRGLETYSRHKFASNVVEKCLSCAGEGWRREVVHSLAGPQQRRSEEGGPLVSLIRDNYGNYVIQKLLDTLSSQDYIDFLALLHPAMQTAKRAGCGKQVLSIEKKMHRFPGYSQNHTQPYHLSLTTPPFGSHYNSAAPTPPPPALTTGTQSLQSSSVPSVNGDTVEGAAALSRKGSEAPSHDSILR